MKYCIKLLICLVSFSIMLQSCRKDSDDITINKDTPPAPVINVYGNVIGKIVDTDSNPVAGAEVIYDSEIYTTDESGLFLLNDVRMNGAGTYLQVEKQGYFTGSRRMYPSQSSTEYIEVMLLDRTVIGSVNAQSGGRLSTQSGASIDLPAGGIIDSDNNTYSGDVNVSMQWLDPTSEDIALMMPGSLEATDAADERVILQTYGMLAVELEAPNGEPLNLGNGGTAELTFPVPNEILDVAPATIPLWFFDEDQGLWKEEGSATLVGDEYVGKVEHFTFWNCDVPFPLLELSGCFQGFEGGILTNTTVEVEVLSSGMSGFTTTNSEGCFTGLVPQFEALQLRLLDKCGNILYEDEIGPFEVDTDLETILFNIAFDSQLTTLEGSLVDCDNQQIEVGVLKVSSDDGEEYYFVDDGEFSVTVNTCPGTDELILAGANVSDDQTVFGNTTTVDVTNSVLDVGTINTCLDPGTLPDTYLRATVNGDSYLWDLESTTGGTSFSQITSNDLEVFIRLRNIFPFDTSAISVSFFDLLEGQNTISDQASISLMNFNGLLNLGENISIGCITCEDVDVFISDIGEVGEFVTGTITKELEAVEADLISIDPSGVSIYPGESLGVFLLELEFRVRRTQ